MTWTKIDNTIIAIGKRVGSAALHIYVVLAQHADAKGQCWPSVRRIAELSGISERSVRRGLRKLQDHGLIIVKARTAKGISVSNLYQLTPPQTPPDKNDTHPSQKRQGGTGKNDTHPLAKAPGELEPKNIDPKNKTASAVRLPKILNTETFRTAWGDYITHRKEKRSTMTPTAVTRAIAKLERMGHDRAVAALDHSVSNGWTGIHEPSTNGKPQQLKQEIVYRDVNK